MGLHANKTSRHAYNRFRVRSLFYYCSSTDCLSSQDRVRAKMKEKGEGLWVAFDDVPRPYRDWLVNEVSKSTLFLWVELLNEQIMNDRSILFICEYSKWAILAMAKKSAAGWQKREYHDHTMEVPKNRRYLTVNSAKRNPNTPRGAWFPAHPSKQGWTSTPDDNNNNGLNDKQIPTLPPSPSTTTLARFLNEGVGSLGAEEVLPSRQIESFLRVFKQLTHTLPSRQVVGYLSICPPL